MRVLILGGDGYLGWPTAMFLSARGHDTAVVDNYFRRRACLELDISMLCQPPSLPARCRIWKETGGREIKASIGDVTDYEFLLGVFKEFAPDAVIHYAEQPSAPYSMLGQKEAVFTLQNNLVGTANIVFAVKEVNHDCHIIKLGTMGEYGTPNIDIEEGYIEIEHKGRRDKFLYPRQAGSLYHTTKIQDTDLLYFYVRAWGIRVTDLMQGPVYGLFTDEMNADARLMPHFNYDDVFGTVLNRFLVQAAAGIPLTVYGKGGQTRGYLNVKDTMKCVELALKHPADSGQLRILNQFTETFSVNELADKVVSAARALGIEVGIRHIENPRVEKEEHYYNPVHSGLVDMGLKPEYLTQDALVQMLRHVLIYKDRINPDIVMPRVRWK
jgi:UDP-sulfoquinovose synthase